MADDTMHITDVLKVTDQLHADLLKEKAANDSAIVHASIIAAVGRGRRPGGSEWNNG